MNKLYYIYILECSDATLYTGITTDIQRRIQEHENGFGAKYTRGRGPFILRHIECLPNRSLAAKREKEIKALTRKEKWELINETRKEYVSSKEL